MAVKNQITTSHNKKNFQNILGIMVLIGTYIMSIVWVIFITLSDNGTKSKTNQKIIRLAHNMAEENTQQAFRDLAETYQKQHPDVTVVIQAIPLGAYQQWVTTQCIGQTAPDIVQAQNKWDQSWASIAARYMVPLTRFVNRPNPYNQGTFLETTPWRETFRDNMRSGFWEHLTEYYSIPMTIETNRIYYNKDIFYNALGTDSPPEYFEDWTEICHKIQKYAQDKNLDIFPLASHGTSIRDWVWYPYYCALTDGMSDPYEPSYWGLGNPMYTLYALYTDTFTFQQPRIKAPFEMARQLAGFCQPGHEAAEISESRFLFIQQKASMIIGNVRDAKVFQEMADFQIGVFDYPLPSPHGKYGEYVIARASETKTPVTHFFLSQTSRHPEIALDFMLFCTSMMQNEHFNAKMHWYPAIEGAEPLEYIKVFAPHIEGAGRRIMFVTHPNFKQVHLWSQQNFPLYLNREITFEDFIADLEHTWLNKGGEDFESIVSRYEHSQIQSERNIAMSHARLLFDQAGEEQSGQVIGERSMYDIAIESNQLLEHGICMSNYTWYHLREGNYEYP